MTQNNSSSSWMSLESNANEWSNRNLLRKVPQIVHPDDKDVNDHPVLGDIPTIGIDNPVFADVDYDTNNGKGITENVETHTPLKQYYNNKETGSNVFVFDPECISLFSRRGSSNLESMTVDLRRDSELSAKLSPLRGSYGQTSQTTTDKFTLSVPSRRTKGIETVYDSNAQKPGSLETYGGGLVPPSSPECLSRNSCWSELKQTNTSRKSSDAGLSDFSRVSNVSSSLSEHLRGLVRAFSSRTEKIKETLVQPPSPSSLSENAASDALSAISAEPHFRHRLDSFMPSEMPEGDTISEIVRYQDGQDKKIRQRFRMPLWIHKLKFPHVIEPQSKLYLLWLMVVTLAFMYNAWAIPFRTVFPYQTAENLHYWLACDYLCDFLYILDIFLFKMRISFLNSGLKETHRSKTRTNYMKKSNFKFDCLSLLPLDILYLIDMKVNPWYRLPRVLKIQTFWEFYSRCDHLVRSAHAVRIIKTLTYMLFLIHVETCGYYALSVHEGIGQTKFVYNGQGNAYIRCFYLATKTATSIGNNPAPTNPSEFMFMTVYWLSGVFVFAVLIGQIRNILDAAYMVKSTYTKRMDGTLYYLKNMNLPRETQNRVRSWFIYNWQQQKVIDERKMMDALPMKLRKDLAIHVHFNTLSKVKLFSDCDKTLLYDLVLKLKPILYLPGDYVCRKGEIGKEMYIVSQGLVEVVGGPNNSLVLATLREGSVFGEISLLAMATEGNRRTADVRCKGFTNLFILSKNDFESAMKEYPEAHSILKKRAKKLLRMNARIERQSQTSIDQSKINATHIIQTPPETPKMVKTVIQVMDPESTLARRLSSKKRSGHDSDEHTNTIHHNFGSDNAAFEPGSEELLKQIIGNSISITDMSPLVNQEQLYNITAKDKVLIRPEDMEDFYNEFLSKHDWSHIDEIDKRNKISASDATNRDDIKDTESPKKTMGNTTATSSNSGDNNENSDFGKKPAFEGINYTADMFGDIESESKNNNDMKSTSIRPISEIRDSTGPYLIEDEYAKSFANGFTIIINSVEDTDTFIESSNSINPDMREHKKGQYDNVKTVNDMEMQQPVEPTDAMKFVSFKHSQKDTQHSKDTNIASDNISSTKRNHSPATVVKQQPAGECKTRLPNKNKLGLKLRTDMKSSLPKAKSQTNRSRQSHNTAGKQTTNNNNTAHANNQVTSDQRLNEYSSDGIIAKSLPMSSINVVEATEESLFDNRDKMERSSPMKITCYADVHREKTLSPKMEKDESLFPCDSMNIAKRKISVISIGSVLKDSRETLV